VAKKPFFKKKKLKSAICPRSCLHVSSSLLGTGSRAQNKCRKSTEEKKGETLARPHSDKEDAYNKEAKKKKKKSAGIREKHYHREPGIQRFHKSLLRTSKNLNQAHRGVPERKREPRQKDQGRNESRYTALTYF